MAQLNLNKIKNMKKLLAIILLLFSSVASYGQLTGGGTVYTNRTVIGTPTPNMDTYINAGNLSLNRVTIGALWSNTPLNIQDEGITLLNKIPSSINFTGAGITVTNTGTTLLVNVPGSSGGSGISSFAALTGVPSDNAALNTILNSREISANKGQVNGYAGLNASGFVPVAQLGSTPSATTLLHGNNTFSLVSLANDVTGNLAVSHFNGGIGASNTTYWRGDGTWATPSGSSGITGITGDGAATGTGTVVFTLGNSGVAAGTYTNPSSVTVDAKGRVTAIIQGSGGSGVTSLVAGTGLSGGTITSSGTIGIAPTGVTAGTYTSANITVNAQGQITNASNGSGGGGSGTVAYTTTAYASSVNLNFTGTNVDLTNVTGNFTLTASSATSGGIRSMVIHKNTASPVVISIDQTTIPAPGIKPLTSTILYTPGAPPTLTLNGASGSIYVLYLMMQGAPGALIPEIQVSTIASENAINVTANYNTVGVNFTAVSATATTTAETAYLTIPIAANSYQAGTYMKVDYTMKTNSGGGSTNSGNVQFKVRLCPTGTALSSCPIIDDYANNNNLTDMRVVKVNFLSTTSARSNRGWSPTNHVPWTSFSTNVTVDMDLIFTMQKQGASPSTDYAEVSDIVVEAGNK
jgi:hypothetical protein